MERTDAATETAGRVWQARVFKKIEDCVTPLAVAAAVKYMEPAIDKTFSAVTDIHLLR